MKVLLIEDHQKLVDSLKEYLQKEATIEATELGEVGIDWAKTRSYDAIILDLNLADINGQEVCKRLRAAGVTTPIIILSASFEPAVKVALLRAGADDYMIKPFHGSELKARLFALLRRGHFDPEGPYILKAGQLSLDPSKRTVEYDGQHIILRRKEFDILEYMLRNKGKILSRSMIMDNAWGRDSESWDNTVDVHVKYLLDKIDKPFGARVINVNLLGCANGARAAIRQFREQGAGSLINVASMVGHAGQLYASAYVSSKWAVRGLSECLRMELMDAPEIHVSTVLPAVIDTPLYQHAANYTGRAIKAMNPVYPPEQVGRYR